MGKTSFITSRDCTAIESGFFFPCIQELSCLFLHALGLHSMPPPQFHGPVRRRPASCSASAQSLARKLACADEPAAPRIHQVVFEGRGLNSQLTFLGETQRQTCLVAPACPRARV